jgi:hypothetical protein
VVHKTFVFQGKFGRSEGKVQEMDSESTR